MFEEDSLFAEAVNECTSTRDVSDLVPVSFALSVLGGTALLP